MKILFIMVLLIRKNEDAKKWGTRICYVIGIVFKTVAGGGRVNDKGCFI